MTLDEALQRCEILLVYDEISAEDDDQSENSWRARKLIEELRAWLGEMPDSA